MSDVSRQITVTELVRNFGEACRALVPSLDRAEIPWTDGRQYDNWDRIAEALFESLVLEPCCYEVWDVEPGRPLDVARYGFVPSSESAFVQLHLPEGGRCRFMRLVSLERPFDHCEGVAEGESRVVALGQAELSFVVLGTGGERRGIGVVDLSR